MKKILLLISDMSAGGAERVASTLVNAWASRGDRVTLMPTFSERRECFYALSPNVCLVYLADLVSRTKRTWINQFARLRALRRFIAAEQPDVIVSFLTNVNVASIIASLGLGIPTVISERNDPMAMPRSFLFKLICRWAYSLADALVVLTKAVAPQYASFGWALRRIRVIANPISEQMIKVQWQHILKDKRCLLAIGRLVDQKQFNALIEIFARLARRYEGWTLRIFGEGPMRVALQKQIIELGLQGRVELRGITTAIEHEMMDADIFVMTSKFEGFPNALLEAMAMGLPCAVYDCPSGPREISEDGHVAMLVPLNDERAMELALEQLMSDVSLRESLGCQARESVLKRFTLRNILAQWDSLFREVGINR